MLEKILNAMNQNFTSANEMDSNFEQANIVDALFFLGRALNKVADAINNNNKEIV